MIDTKTLKVGDSAYTGRNGQFNKVTITKITPAGLIDVQYAGGMIERYNADGNRRKGNSWDYSIDLHMTFEERTVWLSQMRRAHNAATAINSIKIDTVRGEWGKEPLQRYIALFQSQLDAAKELVEKI